LTHELRQLATCSDPVHVSLSVLAFGLPGRKRLDGKLIRAHGWCDDSTELCEN